MWPTLKYSLREAEGDGTGGGGGGGDEKWYAGHITEGADLPQLLTESADFDSFVKQAVDYQAMQGSSIRIPGENASEEDRQAFYTKLTAQVPGLVPLPDPENVEAMKAYHASVGVPEEATGYELPEPPEGQNRDESLHAWFLETAHTRKFSKAQAKGFYEDFNQFQVDAQVKLTADLKAQEVALRDKWGATYEPTMKKIDTFWANYPQFAELRENVKKGLVPGHVLEGFAAVAEGMMGKGFTMLSDEDRGAAGAITPAEASIQVQETIKKLAKMEPNDAARGPMMTRLIELQKLAMPGADHAPPARAGFSS